MMFISNQYSQKEIAVKVGTTEATLSRWVNTGKWDVMRKSMLTTKNEILSSLYNLLDKIAAKLREENSIGDSKTADMYVKYTAAIKNLETETNLAQLMETGRMFVNHLQTIDPAFALSVLEHFDKFIKEQLKRF